jgi:hypothetical protein
MNGVGDGKERGVALAAKSDEWWERHLLGVPRRWLIDRWGPIAPHGVTLVGLYLLFVLLARVASIGRVERDLALYIVVVVIALAFLVICATFVCGLWSALRQTATLDAPDGWRPILLATLGAGLCLLSFPRLISKDMLSYLVYGRAFGTYGLNPYLTTPNNVQFDFNFLLLDWHGAATVYGPVWTLLCTVLYKVITPIATGHIWGYIVSFRALGLAFHLGNAALIWCILGRLRPRDQVAGTIFYAWNPLALIEFASNGHNDAALVFFLLAAVAAHVAEPRRPWLVMLFLTLSVLVKFITLLIIPAYLLLLWRTATVGPEYRVSRARVLAWLKVGVVATGVCLILWAPFAETLRHPLFLTDSAAASRYGNSFLQLVYLGARALLRLIPPATRSDELASEGVKLIGRLAFAGCWLVWTWRARDTASWLRGVFWILFAYLVLATPWFWPWYATWLVALGAIVGGRRPTTTALVFSSAVLVFYVMWGNELPVDPRTLYPIHNAFAFGVPLLILWWQLRRPGAADLPVYGVALPGAAAPAP